MLANRELLEHFPAALDEQNTATKLHSKSASMRQAVSKALVTVGKGL
jgi:hypothetical protein